MPNSTAKEIFSPRDHLSRVLKYRPYARVFYYLLLISAAVLWAPGIYLAIQKLMVGAHLQALEIFARNSILPLVAIGQARFLAKPLAFSTIHVFKNKLIIKRINKEIEISFNDVTQVKFSYIPYFGGWFKVILANQKSYRFTVALERSEYILESIAAFKPEVVPLDDLEAFRRTTVIADHSWARLFDKIRNRKYLLLKFIAIPVVAASLVELTHSFMVQQFDYQNVLYLSLLFLGLQVIISFAGWFTTDLILMVKARADLIKNPNFPRRDVKFEKSLDFISSRLKWALFGLILISFIIFVIIH